MNGILLAMVMMGIFFEAIIFMFKWNLNISGLFRILKKQTIASKRREREVSKYYYSLLICSIRRDFLKMYKASVRR